MKKYVKHISKINYINVADKMMYRVELKPYYSFDFSGSSVTFLNTISDICEVIRHNIVFCDGK